MHWLEIEKEEKISILNKASQESGLEPFAVEKDWWMVQTLRLIWQMDVAEHLVSLGIFPEPRLGNSGMRLMAISQKSFIHY